MRQDIQHIPHIGDPRPPVPLIGEILPPQHPEVPGVAPGSFTLVEPELTFLGSRGAIGLPAVGHRRQLPAGPILTDPEQGHQANRPPIIPTAADVPLRGSIGSSPDRQLVRRRSDDVDFIKQHAQVDTGDLKPGSELYLARHVPRQGDLPEEVARRNTGTLAVVPAAALETRPDITDKRTLVPAAHSERFAAETDDTQGKEVIPVLPSFIETPNSDKEQGGRRPVHVDAAVGKVATEAAVRPEPQSTPHMVRSADEPRGIPPTPQSTPESSVAPPDSFQRQSPQSDIPENATRTGTGESRDDTSPDGDEPFVDWTDPRAFYEAFDKAMRGDLDEGDAGGTSDAEQKPAMRRLINTGDGRTFVYVENYRPPSTPPTTRRDQYRPRPPRLAETTRNSTSDAHPEDSRKGSTRLLREHIPESTSKRVRAGLGKLVLAGVVAVAASPFRGRLSVTATRPPSLVQGTKDRYRVQVVRNRGRRRMIQEVVVRAADPQEARRKAESQRLRLLIRRI